MLPRFVVVVVLALACSQGARAQAGRWFTTAAVLKELFPTSERVSFVTVDGAALAGQGIPGGAKQHHVYVAWTGAHLDGYAVVDDERGQHEPISFAVQIDAALAVQRVEVMAYREAYGAEIRAARYRKQFVGKTQRDLEPAAVAVDAISGATLSCQSTVIVVRRALALAALAKTIATNLPPSVGAAP